MYILTFTIFNSLQTASFQTYRIKIRTKSNTLSNQNPTVFPQNKVQKLFSRKLFTNASKSDIIFYRKKKEVYGDEKLGIFCFRGPFFNF